MVSSAVSEFSAEKCRELGFNKANLFCSSCEKLNHFNLTELEAPCKECCQGDTDLVETKKYPKAVLEVSFVKSERARGIPNFSVKYVRGADPIIKLYDEENRLQETYAVDKWNTDSVDEFLNTVLLMDDSISNEL
ncbi:hypothetical protein QYM36_005757 [Artemia franciscana]|uniref:Selenoprotein F n=1 Tax=Artemia franciscana TaxID=6661 RepID=A0AA88LAS4_ARTSF|nr:hypothetical protein QYM36_005757 [Artemia franciscana]